MLPGQIVLKLHWRLATCLLDLNTGILLCVQDVTTLLSGIADSEFVK